MTKTGVKTAASPDQAVIVTIDPSQSLAQLLGALRKAGLQVRDTMELLNTVSGQATPKAIAALRKLPGVLGVEADTIVKLDPREVPDMGAGFVAGSSWRSSNWDD